MRFRRAKGKYGAKRSKCLVYKHNHRSKLEASLCDWIAAKEQTREYRRLGTEVSVRLSAAGIRYVADFHVRDLVNMRDLFLEAKGMETERFRVIKQLWREYGPAPLLVFKGTASRFKLAYTIDVGGA
jgi:hypothetical protein